MTTARAYIDRSLDMLDAWMREQQERVVRTLHESDARLAELRHDGMERYHMRTETTIRRQA